MSSFTVISPSIDGCDNVLIYSFKTKEKRIGRNPDFVIKVQCLPFRGLTDAKFEETKIKNVDDMGLELFSKKSQDVGRGYLLLKMFYTITR